MDQITESDLVRAVEAALAIPGATTTDDGIATTAELAEIFGCAEKRVRKALRSLKREGLIEPAMKYCPPDLVSWGQMRAAYRFIGGQDALEKLVERLK